MSSFPSCEDANASSWSSPGHAVRVRSDDRARLVVRVAADEPAAPGRSDGDLGLGRSDGDVGLGRSDEGVAAVPAAFEVRVAPDREAVWLEPVGELDLAAAPQLGERVDELLEVGFEHVVVDLRGLSFMDLAGLRLLSSLAARARADGWRLSLIQGCPAVRRLFELTDTLEQLPFTYATALSAR